MAGAFLPPVTVELKGDISPLLADLAAAKAAIKALGDTTVRIRTQIDSSQLNQAARGLNAVADASKVANRSLTDLSGTTTRHNAILDAQVQSMQRYRSALGDTATAVERLDQSTRNYERTLGTVNRTSGIGSYGGGGGSSTRYTNGGSHAPGWIGWMTNKNNIDAMHSAAIAVAALGSAVAGAAIGMGAYAAVAGPGAYKFGQQGYYTYQGESAQGRSLSSILGLNPNPAMRSVQQQGYGQTAQLYGGIINFLNQHQGTAMATEGSQVSAGLDQYMAKFDLMKSQGGGVLGDLNQDATNLGHSLAGIGNILSTAFRASPGELEWLTNGLADAVGLGTKLVHIPGLIETFMMLHSLTFLSGGVGKLLTKGGGAASGALSSSLGLTVGEDGALMLASGGAGAEAEEFAMHGMTTKALGANLMAIPAALLGGEAMGRTSRLGSISGLFSKMAGKDAQLAALQDGENGARFAIGGEGVASDLSKVSKLRTGLMGVSSGAEDAGAALMGMGTGATLGIGAAVVAIGLLVDKVATTKNAAQQLFSSFQGANSTKTVSQLFGALPNEIGQMGQLGNRLNGQIRAAVAKAPLNANSPASMGRFGPIGGGVSGQTEEAADASMQVPGNIQKLASGYVGTAIAVQNLAHSLGVSYPQAVAIADQAGLHMNKSMTGFAGGAKVATQEAKNYITALGQIGTGAVAVYTKVSQVFGSRAWQNAGNMNSAFDTATTATNAPAAALSSIYSSLNKTPTGNAKSMIQTGNAITSGVEPMIDALRQAASVGAISGRTLSKGMAEAAASIIPLVGNSQAAKNAVLQLANEGGGHFTTLAQVMKAGGGTATNALNNLNNTAGTAESGLSKLGSLGQQVGQDMQANLAQKIAQTAGQFPNLKNQITTTIGVLGTFPAGSKQAVSAVQNLANHILQSGGTAKQAESLISQFGYSWKQLPNGQLKVNTIQTNVITKNITENELYNNSKLASGGSGIGVVTKGNLANLKHNAGGRPSGSEGWSWVGEHGPELVQLTPGQRVMTSPQSMVNSNLAGGGDTHVHVYLDSQEMTNAVKSQVYKYNVRNGNRDATGRPAGNFRPRG